MTIKDLKERIKRLVIERGVTPHIESNTIVILTPEQRYAQRKRDWYFHKASWYMNGDHDDGKHCNPWHCIPECEYYEETGRIEDEV